MLIVFNMANVVDNNNNNNNSNNNKNDTDTCLKISKMKLSLLKPGLKKEKKTKQNKDN